MRLAALGLVAAVAGCAAAPDATVGRAAPEDVFVTAANQVMVFSPTAAALGEGRGYTALVYRGLRSPSEAVFEQVPYPNPPIDAVPTSVPRILVPVNADAPASDLAAPGDVLVTLDARQGAELGVEDVAVEIISATAESVTFRVEQLTP